MKKTRTLPTRFTPETRFAVNPAPPAPFRATQETKFERLKSRLLRELLQATTDPDLRASLRRAANDVASVAWLSGFPLLFLPALVEEKAQAARRQMEHQRRVLKRCQPRGRMAA
jgi:hypothetical protein